MKPKSLQTNLIPRYNKIGIPIYDEEGRMTEIITKHHSEVTDVDIEMILEHFHKCHDKDKSFDIDSAINTVLKFPDVVEVPTVLTAQTSGIENRTGLPNQEFETIIAANKINHLKAS